MEMCCYCREEKETLVNLKGFRNDILVCLRCRSKFDMLSHAVDIIDFAEKIKINYESLKKIKLRRR